MPTPKNQPAPWNAPLLHQDTSEWASSCNLCSCREASIYAVRGGSEHCRLVLTVCRRCLDSLAEQVAASAPAREGRNREASVGAERDRLRDILDAERGERAPEGWTWHLIKNESWADDFNDEGVWAWRRGRNTRIVRSAKTGRWMAWTLMPGLRNSWNGQADESHTPTALEAIEAADAARKEAPDAG